MAEIDAGKPKIKHRRSSVLPSCFGCVTADDDGGGEGEESPKIIEFGTEGRRRRRSWKRRWILVFKFRTKNSATKTVPLDNLSIEQRNQRKNVENEGTELKSSEFMTEKQRIPVKIDEKAVMVQPVLAFLSDQKVPAGKCPKVKYETVQKTILESHDQQDPFHSMKDDPVHKKKSLQKQRSELTQTTNLPEDSPLANNFMIRQSSLPLPARTKPAHSRGRTLRKRSGRKDDELAGEFKPVVGLSVLIVVLAILLLWGKLCAILCTSAWFYFIPSFRKIVKFTDATGENYGGLDDSGKINLDSDEYKKKVILEGLLERKRRNHTG